MAISRRKLLLGAVTVSAGWAGWGVLPAWGLVPAPASGAVDPAPFMQLSTLLVNHRLDAAIGARIAAGAGAVHPQWQSMGAQIIAIAQERKAQAVEDFFDAIPEGALRDYAHWVIFAWYTGCSSNKKDAQVFSFEGALTYATTRDAVAIPSYGFSGPNLWQRPIAPLSPQPVF
jgi:hypothetical protein